MKEKLTPSLMGKRGQENMKKKLGEEEYKKVKSTCGKLGGRPKKKFSTG